MAARTLHVQFFPTIPVFSIGGIGILFPQWLNVGAPLQVPGVNTCARGKKKPLNPTATRRLDRMDVDHGAVADDLGFVTFDKADPSHLRSERVNFIDTAGDLKTVIPLTKI